MGGSSILTLVLVRFFASNEAASKGNSALLALGTATAVFQALGFSRWIFTVPMLAKAYFAPNATEASKQSIALMYDTLNRYLGMTVGEHLGFIAMGAWTLLLAWQIGVASIASTRVSRVLAWIGYTTGVLVIVSTGEHFGGSTAGVFAVLNIIANTVWTIWIVLLAVVVARIPAHSTSAATRFAVPTI